MNEADPTSASTHGSELSSKFPTSPSAKPSSRRSSSEEEEDKDNQKGEPSQEPLKISEVNSLTAAPEVEASAESQSTATADCIEPQLKLDNVSKGSSKISTSPERESVDPISILEKITNDQLHSCGPSSLSNSVVIASKKEKKRRKDSDEEVLDIQAIEEDVHTSFVHRGPAVALAEGTAKHPKTSGKPEADTTKSTSKVRSPPSVTKIPGKSRKPAIPVGIAVAWQRSSATATTTMSVSSTRTIDSKSLSKAKKLSTSPVITSPTSSSMPVLGNGSLSPTKEQSSKSKRPETSEREGTHKNKMAVDKDKSKSNVFASAGAKISTPQHTLKNDINSAVLSMKPNSKARSDELNKSDKTKTIASAGKQGSAPSAKLGVVQNNVSNASSNSGSERFSASGDGFRSLNNNNSPYRDSWPSSQLLVPQDYAAAAAYLQHQQLSMHQTMQLQLSQTYGYNMSSCIYAGYPADSLLQYEQLLRQQQQQQRQDQDSIELARRHLISGNGIRTPIPQSSPKINIPTPTPSPAHLSSSTTQQSLYSQHSLWPADLYQHYQPLIPPAAHQYQCQQQPPAHLIQQHVITTATASSTATLSPRSLSSATPSPITIHDSSFQSLLNRKCVTPNPTAKHFPAFSSPFSPTLVPGKDSSSSWRDDGFVDGKLTPLPLVVNSRKKSSTISSLEDIEESRDEETDDESRKRSRLTSPTMPNYKHDFRRMESLIEKRAEATLPLLSSSSESLNANYSQEPEEGEEEAVNLKVDKDLVVRKDETVKETNCDGEMKSVPEQNSAFTSLKMKRKEIKCTKKSELKKKPQIPDDQKLKKQTQKDPLPKKPRKEKESKGSAKPKMSAGIDHQFDLISKAKKKQTSTSSRKAKEDTQEINKSRNSDGISGSIKKKSGKYFTINNNFVEIANSGKKPSSKLSRKHASSFASNDSDIGVSGRKVAESINYAQGFEYGLSRITKNDQNVGNSSHDIVSAKPSANQPDTHSPTRTFTSSTIYCDNSGSKHTASTFDLANPVTPHVNNSTSFSPTASSSSPISPNLQYQQQFHPVFTSPQTPAPVERRLSSHSSSNSIESASTIAFSSLPTIVISPEDNHLNLLAAVAVASESNHNSGQQHDDYALRRHSTESLYAAVAAAAAAEQNNFCTTTQETSPIASKRDEHLPSSCNTKALIAISSSQTSNNISAPSLFELQIPHIQPRVQDVHHKKKKSNKQQQQEEGKPKAKGKKEKPANLSRTEPKQMRKNLDSSGQSNLKAIKLGKPPQVRKESKLKLAKNSMHNVDAPRIQNDAKKLVSSKTATASQNAASEAKTYNSNNSHAHLSSPASIYDFDGFDDTKPEIVDPFANRPEKGILSCTPRTKSAGLTDTRSGTAGVKKSSQLRSGFLGKKLSALIKPVKEGRKLVKIRHSGKDDLKTATNIGKRKEILASRKSFLSDIAKSRDKKEKTKKHSEDNKSATEKVKKDMNQNVSGDKTTATKKPKIPNTAAAANKKSTNTALVEDRNRSTEISPAVGNVNLKNEVVARTLPFLSHLGSHIPRTQTSSSTDPCSSNESSSSAWTTITNPTHIVSAVKMETPIKNDPYTCEDDANEWPKSPSLPAPRRKLLLKPPKLDSDRDSRSPSAEPVKRMRLLKESSFDRMKFGRSKSPPKRKSSKDSDFKPYLKVEPILQSSSDSDDESEEETRRETRKSARSNVAAVKAAEKIKGRKASIDMNIFSRKVKPEADSSGENMEEGWDENVVIVGVHEMIDEMRILTEIEGLFYTGKLNALQPPDVYGVTLDNERGAPPHIIFSAEEVIGKCIREAKPWKPSQLPHGLRICAYWSPQYTGLYPGKVSTDYDTVSDLVPVEFDDGDTGVIKIGEIRLLAPNHPVAEYDPNPLLTLEKKHRKRRNSSANGSQGGCTGDHEERDCGEPYCAKVAKLQEEEEAEDDDEVDEYDKNFNDIYRTKMKYWTWTGLGYKIPKTKKNRHKEFFHGIQRGDEVINVGDSALFISNGNDRPFIGRIERLWEKKGQKIVHVRWYYHPEEIKAKKRIAIKYPGALFESTHIDENDVQTIAKKCNVIPFGEYKHKYGSRLQLNWKAGGKGSSSIDNRKKAPKHTYYVAGFYDPYTFKLQMKDLK